MLLLANVGEWVNSNILFGLVFLVASLGVVAIGWWVIRGDRLNRAVTESELGEPPGPAAVAHAEAATPTDEPAPAPQRRTRRRPNP